MEVRVVKSPLPYGIENLPESTQMGFVTTNITLESGIVITNSNQFSSDDDFEKEATDYETDS